MKKIDYICNKCYSVNICWDAWSKWNPETQEDELNQSFDYCFCEDCEGETSPLEVEFKTDRDYTDENNRNTQWSY